MPAVQNIISTSELTIIYSTLILYNHEVTAMEGNINVLIKAAGINVEPFWPGLFTKSLTNPTEHWSLICNGGAGGPAPAAGATPAGPALSAVAPAEEKEGEAEKEESELSDDETGFGLFD